jgi:molybdate transport system ATP-binding protein
VLERGRVAQAGPPAEITNRPLTPYVARLVGMNLYVGTASGDTVRIDGGGTIVAAAAPAGRVLATVRPSAITVHTETPHGSSARNVWAATIASLAPLGDRVRVNTAGELAATVDVTAAAVAELALAPGLRVWLSAKATDVTAYPAP